MVWYGILGEVMVGYYIVLVCFGMVWYVMVWYGTIWYGMVRYGVGWTEFISMLALLWLLGKCCWHRKPIVSGIVT